MLHRATTAAHPTVLIVEDEPLIAWDIEEHLKGAGYNVAGIAETPAAAHWFLDQGGIDCVVLDLNLRGELTTPLAFALKARCVPFILCTAYTKLLDVETGAFEGAPVASKPILASGLLAALDRALQNAVDHYCRHSALPSDRLLA